MKAGERVAEKAERKGDSWAGTVAAKKVAWMVEN